MRNAVKVSLVATVKNEANNIADLLDSMLSQTYPPDEIVVNDNGSTDGTAQIIERYIAAGYPIKLVRGRGNIPTGRNRAVRNAGGQIIACCDAGLTLPPRWLETLTAPLLRGEADVASGFFEPDARSLWEIALAATNYPVVGDVDPNTFLPGGHSIAFTREAWEAVDGYPEWADTCEDIVFDLALKRQGFRFTFIPQAAVRFRPRPTPWDYARQYFGYARGDGVAGLWPERHALRYCAYAGLILLGLAAWYSTPWILLALIPAIATHTLAPYRRLWTQTRRLCLAERCVAFALIPMIRLLGDIAKMIGYPVGLWRRMNDPLHRSRYRQMTRSKCTHD
jgi:cellulose synthase/poly-beta-1,6-N-acetylglucosamine synthase-like glycosyltransferase